MIATAMPLEKIEPKDMLAVPWGPAIDVIFEGIERLELTPWIGRPGRQADTRELVLVSVPFIVAYRVIHETVQVLRVLHTSRRWPKLPWWEKPTPRRGRP